MYEERLLEHRGDSGDDDGKMHRQATGHDCVDRQFFRGDRSFADRFYPDQMIRRQHRPLETGLNGVRCWRNDRQAIRPFAAVVKFLRREDVFDLITF